MFLIAANHAFFFTTPWHENGDFALNALQIERAKHLNEFYGNYSRFHFNHPGPAFFYIYAAAEYLLHDWLQVVPTPHNAHALAGTALQVLFFALALGIVAQWVRARWFVPLSIALGAVHFGLAQNAFTSIWPPHVLLMPFLCFLVAAASTAAGQARHLPLTVLAGCFLVHGHIAQPLLVGITFLASYAFLQRAHSAEDRSGTSVWRRHAPEHWLSVACIAVFLIPIGVDLTLGSESNFVEILQFSTTEKDHRTLVEAAVYLLSFFGYVHDQEWHMPEGGPIQFGFLLQRWTTLLGWAVIVSLVFWGVRRLGRQPEQVERHRFLQALLRVIGVCIFATLLWGKLQNGPMFEFNAHFIYALIYALLLVAAALLAIALPARGAMVGGTILCVVGAAVAWDMSVVPESTKDAEFSWREATVAALKNDPQPSATKFLVFNHDDWGDSARTALALKRLGESYRVAPNWSFMFGRYRTASADELSNPAEKFSIWRLSRQPLQGRSAPLERGLRVFFDEPQLFPASTVIDCRRGGNLEQFALVGFTAPDEKFSWTNLPKAALRFRSPSVMHDVDLAITAEPFATHQLGPQVMHLWVNGEKITSTQLAQPGTVRLKIPASSWNRGPLVTVVFEFPGATSPRKLGIGADPRLLAWGISRIVFGTEHP